MDCFGVITGIDMNKMGEEHHKEKDKRDEEDKLRREQEI
jgi:hypothetical protein